MRKHLNIFLCISCNYYYMIGLHWTVWVCGAMFPWKSYSACDVTNLKTQNNSDFEIRKTKYLKELKKVKNNISYNNVLSWQNNYTCIESDKEVHIIIIQVYVNTGMYTWKLLIPARLGWSRKNHSRFIEVYGTRLYSIWKLEEKTHL